MPFNFGIQDKANRAARIERGAFDFAEVIEPLFVRSGFELRDRKQFLGQPIL